MRFNFRKSYLRALADQAKRIAATMLLPGGQSPGSGEPTQPVSFWPNASAAILALLSSVGAALFTPPGNWGQGATPALGAVATTTKAAVAGARHVCTSVAATLATAAAAQAAAAILVLRDGISGAGTILWTKQVILPINGVWEVNISGLNIVGSVNTAMTLEFTAAPAAGASESVTLTGYDAS